jgi:hypothetical protein
MRSPIALAILSGALLYLALHLFEPALPATWAYAHLGRHAGLVALAIAAIAILPFLALAADRSPVLEGPWPAASRRTAFVCGLSLSLLFLAVGWRYPAKPLCIDSPWFAIEVYLGRLGCMRWYLTLATYTPLLRVAEWIAPFPVPARTFVTVLNAFASGAAYVLLLGCARRLGRDRFEVVAITLLTWGAFGNFQLVFHYMDVYPVAQLCLALYLWTSLRSLDGEIGLVWPFVVLALIPFFYVGLVLLGPSALVLIWAARRRPGFVRELAVAVAAAVIAGGLAMVPGYGIPFAFAPYLRDLVADSAAPYGFDPDSSLLPIRILFTEAHLTEVWSVLLLIDGIGLLLCATAGWALWGRERAGGPDMKALLLVVVLIPQLVYLFWMDAVWGAYLDWDLFSYVAIPTSLLGGYALMVWGRPQRRLRAVLLGLLLAATGVHLLAKTNALELGYAQHLVETPMHPTLPSGPPP